MSEVPATRFVQLMRLNSLSVRILIAYIMGVVLSVLLIAATAALIVLSKGDVLSGLDVAHTTRDLAEELQFDSQGVPVGVGDGRFDYTISPEWDDDFDLTWVFTSLKEEAAYRVLDAAGRPVLVSAAGATFWLLTGDAQRLERGQFEFTRDGVAIRGATEVVVHDGHTWHFQFAVSQRFLHLIYEAFALPFTVTGVSLFGLVLLLVFGPCVYITLRFALRPVRQVSAARLRFRLGLFMCDCSPEKYSAKSRLRCTASTACSSA